MLTWVEREIVNISCYRLTAGQQRLQELHYGVFMLTCPYFMSRRSILAFLHCVQCSLTKI